MKKTIKEINKKILPKITISKEKLDKIGKNKNCKKNTAKKFYI
jgi:hypothetical protein